MTGLRWLGVGLRTKLSAAMRRAVTSGVVPPLLILDKVAWGLKFGEWLKTRGGSVAPCFRERFALYHHLNTYVLKEGEIDYLEFGVADGGSIREWLRLNRCPGSRFFGFDTFEGLPEEWKGAVGVGCPEGSFSTNGRPPVIEGEARAAWLIGLFQDTLPSFLERFQARSRLVVHLDADLYSSTLYALAMLNRVLREGSIVLFDEFWSYDNEFRAFKDFVSSFRRRYRVVACAGRHYSSSFQVAVEFQE